LGYVGVAIVGKLLGIVGKDIFEDEERLATEEE
jgi:hypothetical protein